jgi:DNA gyrase subunit B
MQKYPQPTSAPIQQLSARELVRKRPGMFVGGKDKRALHHLVYLVLDYGVEEAMNMGCSSVWITLNQGEQVTITDDSHGLPTYHDESGRSMLEVIMTTTAQRSYTPSVYNPSYYYGVNGGLHGLGVDIANILSAECRVEVRKSDTLWRQSYKEGIPQTPVEMIRPRPLDEFPGMSITFTPDFTIFEPNTFDYDILAKRCREITYLIPRLTIVLRDEREETLHEDVFHAPNGLTDWIHALNAGKMPLHEVVTGRHEVETPDRQGNLIRIGFEFAFQYTDDVASSIIAYTNMVQTPEGGTHQKGLLEGLRYALKRHWQRPTYQRMLLPGLTAVVSVLHPSPSFENPIKVKLMTPEVEKLARQAVLHTLKQRPDVLAAMARKFA